MTTRTSTLRPGLLVSLNTSLRGNVSYDKTDLDNAREGDTATAEWNTKRTIADVNEFEAAKKVVGKACNLIRGVCAKSMFGLLCPEGDSDILDEKIAEAQALVDEFNASAKLTRVHVYCMTGRIAADDVQAVKKISSEVRSLMADMETGLKNLDVQMVREAANKAKSVGAMLTPDAEGRVTKAIELARTAARKIVKAGEEGSVEIDRVAIRKIAEQRNSFLDLDESEEIQKPTAKTRRVDLSAEEEAYNAENIARGKEIDRKRRKADREATPANPNDVIPQLED